MVTGVEVLALVCAWEKGEKGRGKSTTKEVLLLSHNPPASDSCSTRIMGLNHHDWSAFILADQDKLILKSNGSMCLKFLGARAHLRES